MKRYLIFGLLGPLFGYITFLLQDAGIRGQFSVFLTGLVIGIFLAPYVYGIGLIPALIAASADHYADNFKMPLIPRCMVACAAGCLATYVFCVVLAAFSDKGIPSGMLNPGFWKFSLTGAVAALACCVLTASLQRAQSE